MIDLLHVQRNNEIVGKYKTGSFSKYKLAKQYNLTERRVREILNRFNINRQDIVPMKIRNYDIKKLRDQGMSWFYIELFIGVTCIQKHINTKDYPRYGANAFQKYCPNCKQVKLKTDFHAKTNWCKLCVKTKHRSKHNDKGND